MAKQDKQKGLLRKFAAAFGSNPKAMLVVCWLAVAYLIPILLLPWLLMAYALHHLGIPVMVSTLIAAIPALIGLRIHMQWRQ